MHHLILGYGYCGYYLAQELLKQKQQVTAISRHLNKDFKLPGLIHRAHNLDQPFHWTEPDTIIYYLIPPSPQGENDTFLTQFLEHSILNARKVVYFSSSGVYGSHNGAWVNEDSECIIKHPRQLRRLSAEALWQTYCKQHEMVPILLRVAGIYGPNRLPIEAAKTQTPLIETQKAPLINHIYVKDLASIAYLLTQIDEAFSLYNVADGNPQPMGTVQQLIACALGIRPASYETWQEIWETSTPMKREFMLGSKRLCIDRLKETLGDLLQLSSINDVVRRIVQEN